jgi:hypothetical protein
MAYPLAPIHYEVAQAVAPWLTSSRQSRTLASQSTEQVTPTTDTQVGILGPTSGPSSGYNTPYGAAAPGVGTAVLGQYDDPKEQLYWVLQHNVKLSSLPWLHELSILDFTVGERCECSNTAVEVRNQQSESSI